MACIKHNLLSLIGILAHASKVVKNSRTFLQRLIDLLTKAKDPSLFIQTWVVIPGMEKSYHDTATAIGRNQTNIRYLRPLGEPIGIVSGFNYNTLLDMHISTKELTPL